MEIMFKSLPGYEWMPQPQPASKMVPGWYKDMPQRMPSEAGEFPFGTVKLCSPFGDALMAGYLMRLPRQVFVRCLGDDTLTASWPEIPGQSWQVVSEHSAKQLPGFKFQGSPSILKFNLPWAVEVPEGYAVLYTHPMNRPDLPFYTFSGLIDSAYKSNVHFPFLWVAGEQETILDAGMPIAQLIPIRLEEWGHKFSQGEESEVMNDVRTATGHITGYRRIFRRNKTWA